MTNLPVPIKSKNLVSNNNSNVFSQVLDIFDEVKKVPMKVLENQALINTGVFEVAKGLFDLGNNYVDYKKAKIQVEVEEYRLYQEQEKTKQIQSEVALKKFEAEKNHENIVYGCKIKQEEYELNKAELVIKQQKMNYAKNTHFFL